MQNETREQHLQWCKNRALQYCDNGNPQDAFASMTSDLGKHPETEGHIGIQLGFMEMMSGRLNTSASMRTFIEGFN